jgi:hypothetical protein
VRKNLVGPLDFQKAMEEAIFAQTLKKVKFKTSGGELGGV